MGWDECVFECGHNATFRMPAHPEKGICGCCLLYLKTLFTLNDEEIVMASADGSPNCQGVINNDGVLDISEYRESNIPDFNRKYTELVGEEIEEDE